MVRFVRVPCRTAGRWDDKLRDGMTSWGPWGLPRETGQGFSDRRSSTTPAGSSKKYHCPGPAVYTVANTSEDVVANTILPLLERWVAASCLLEFPGPVLQSCFLPSWPPAFVWGYPIPGAGLSICFCWTLWSPCQPISHICQDTIAVFSCMATFTNVIHKHANSAFGFIVQAIKVLNVLGFCVNPWGTPQVSG